MKKTITVITAVVLCFAAALVGACAPEKEVESVTISGGDTVNLGFNETKTFTAAVSPADASNKTLVWSIKETDLPDNGYVFAESTFTSREVTGYAVIEAKSANGKSAAVRVNVADTAMVTSVIVDGEKDREAAFGETVNFTASVLPENTPDKSLVWEVASTNLKAGDYLLTAGGKLTVGEVAGYLVIDAKAVNGVKGSVTVVINRELSGETDNRVKVTFLAPDGVSIVDIRYAEKGGTVTPPDYKVSNYKVDWLDANGAEVDFGVITINEDSIFTAKTTAETIEYYISYWYYNGDNELVQSGRNYVIRAGDSVPAADVAEIKAAAEQATGKVIINWKQEISDNGRTIKLIAEFANTNV